MITSLKRFLKSFFGLSRTETNGFLILLPLILLIIFSEPIYAWWISNNRHDDFSAEKATLDSLTKQWEMQRKDAKAVTVVPVETDRADLFAFDPNNAKASQLSSLGLSSKLVSHIVHYREKGGKFKIKSDLLKIYGMDSQVYRRLYSYIQLPDKIEQPVFSDRLVSSTARKERSKFDLNNADTTQLKGIYGIGSKLSVRIIKYRQRLGGFVNLRQLTEVYGLDSIVISKLLEQSFILADFQPSKININKATEKELGSHPYLTKSMASTIAAYRFQHGNFKEVADLRKLHLLKDEMIEKISPYLAFDE